MELTFGNALTLVRLSLRDPRQGLRAVLDLPLSAAERWMVAGLSMILPTLMIFISLSLAPMPDGSPMFPLSPFALLGVQGSAILMMSSMTYAVGRWRGGRGSFSDALLTIGWLQLVMVAVQVALLLLELAFPPVAAVLGVVATVLMFWLLTNFVAEVHGFTSLPLTFLGIVATMTLAALVLALLMGPFLGASNV